VLCFVSLPGMYQRLDKMRKNAFASMCLFGSDNDSSISGIWVWRGRDLAFEVCSLNDIIVTCNCVVEMQGARCMSFCSDQEHVFGQISSL
jgi:hypothetical protein